MDSLLLQQLENRVTEINTALTIITRWIKTENDRRQDNQSLLEQLVNHVNQFENSLISWIKTQIDNQEIQNLQESNYSGDEVNKIQTRSQKKIVNFPTSKFQPKSKLNLRPVVVIPKEDYKACEVFCQLNKPVQVEATLQTVQTLHPLVPERSELCSLPSPEVFDQIHNEAEIPISETIELSSPTYVNAVDEESESEENVDLSMLQEANFEEAHLVDDVIEVQVIKPDPGQFEINTTDSTTIADNFYETGQGSLESQTATEVEASTTQNSTTKYKRRRRNYGPQTCEICGKILAASESLLRHRKTIHNTRSYKCTICKQLFKSILELITHRQSVHKKLLHNCPICTKTFAKKLRLYDHILGFHKEQPEKYGLEGTRKRTPIGPQECDTCGKTYESYHVLYDHKYKAHGQRTSKTSAAINNKSLICDICGKVFAHTNNLKNHKNTIHAEKKFLCPKCGRAFARKDTLQDHMECHNRTYDPDRKTPKNRAGYRMSEFMGRPDGPLPCEVCGKIQCNWAVYLKHKRLYHNNSNIINTCEICNKVFKHIDTLRRHKSTVHAATKKFVCEECGKGFTRNDKLKEHLKSHL